MPQARLLSRSLKLSGQSSSARVIAAVMLAVTTFAVDMVMTARAEDTVPEIYKRRLQNDFAASAEAIAFSVALARDTVGLVFVERDTRRQRLITDNDLIIVAPFFSKDGQRLLFVQRKTHDMNRELVSCEIATWRCRVLLRTSNTIISPVELNPGTIFFSSSKVTFAADAKWPDRRIRSDSHHFYLFKDEKEPQQLTNLTFYQLYALSVTPTELLFSAVGPSKETPIIPEFKPLSPASDIFALGFNPATHQIHVPSEMLQPLFLMEGRSVTPSASADGEYVAFLNRRPTRGKIRFNLVLARRDETILKYVEAEGIAFSRAAFVGNHVLARELLDDRYRVTEFELPSTEARAVLELSHSVSSLLRLERIQIHVAD